MSPSHATEGAVVTTPEAPLFIQPSSTGKKVARRVGAVILSGLLMVMLLFSTLTHTANSMFGTADRASSTLLSVVTTPAVAAAVADKALTDISDHSSPAVKVAIAHDRARLVGVIATTIQSSATQAIVRIDVRRAYQVFENSSGGSIDLTPLVEQFTSALHAINPAIPADPRALGKNFVVHVKAHRAANISSGLNLIAWVLTAVGLIGAVLVARFLVANHVRRLVAVGLTVGLPGLVATAVGAGASHGSGRVGINDPTSRELFLDVLHRFGSSLERSGLFLLAADVVIVLGWVLIRQLRGRAPSLPAGAETSASPTPI